jgi:UDP-GlcNAc:undecaprenyl-phosphate/decaprenyl-phosphate GlcNAc-1-phosphate transferase
MTALIGGLVVGFLVARLLWLGLAPLFESPALARSNFRGTTLPTAAGVILPLVALAVEGGRLLTASFGVGEAGLTSPRVLVLLAVLGYGMLGLVDDLVGTGDHKGFRGHGSALLSGQVTSGLLKLAGGAAVAILVVAPLVGESPGRLVADALLVALAANLANLLDRAPGRTTKVATIGFALLLLGAGAHRSLVPVAVVLGAALGLLLDDLRERLMLGDAGANPLGGVLGLAVVLTAGPGVRDVVLVALVTLNVAGEVVSFSRVIDLVPPLRALDRAGRRRS